MRRIVTVAAGAAVVLAAALPAQAKVAGTASITGPGGGPGGGISIGGSDGAGWPVVSGMLDGHLMQGARPDVDLGPRFRVRYVIDEPPNQPPIMQHLYPYAEGGPYVYTPPGQPFLGGEDGTAPAGWFAGGAELSALLEDAGLPLVPRSEPNPEAPTLAPATGTTPLVWPVLAAASILAAVVGARAAGRRRAAARAARAA